MRNVVIIFFSFVAPQAFSQSVVVKKAYYDQAYSVLEDMLVGRSKISFKKAVFASENAYLDNQEDYAGFNDFIGVLAKRAALMADQMDLVYSGPDKDKVRKLAAVFRLMTDTTTFVYTESDTAKSYLSLPYRYDFEDFWGEKNWKKMFVSKLLLTNQGNCHSLPILYKIITEELGVRSYLALAPNHIYIKNWCKEMGWYNTELTSGYFPIDAWIMASGYIHLSAVQNRVYMDTLSDQQSIALCLVDLAKGYERKFGDSADHDFILNCCNLALSYYPQYVNGLILKAETLKKQFEKRMFIAGAKSPSEMFDFPESKALFDQMQGLYIRVHQLGYRQMPKEMYAAWLADLNKEKEKYTNKNLLRNLNTKD